jgi:hypothetical protein
LKSSRSAIQLLLHAYAARESYAEQGNFVKRRSIPDIGRTTKDG